LRIKSTIKGKGKRSIEKYFQISNYIEEDLNEFGLSMREISKIHEIPIKKLKSYFT